MAELIELQKKLKTHPENWDLRLEVIEELSRRDRIDEARQLVRTSPEGPVPHHIQSRLWEALSGNSSVRVEGTDGDKPNLVAKAKIVGGAGKKEETSNKIPDPPSREPKKDEKPQPYQHSKEETKADVEAGKVPPPPDRSARKKKSDEALAPGEIAEPKAKGDGELAPPPKLKQNLAPAPQLKKRDPSAGKKEDARFAMSPIEDMPKRRRDRRTGSQKFSAITMAIVVHVFLLIATAFVGVFVPMGRAPIIAMIPATPAMEEELVRTQIVQKTDVTKPAAPSAAATAVVTVEGESSFVAPQFDQINQSFDVNLLDSGVGMSRGFSLEGEGVESNVNFFGLEAGGQRMCFIIDAEPAMLLDEKGGMFAYDKVKHEIGAMLDGLSRGTAFNIIVYQGKRMSFYRERPVRALPSNVRRAKEWMDPINRNYEALGLREGTMEGIKPGAEPIHYNDISGHNKAIQAAMEMDVNAIFCISNGFTQMSRSLSPEDQAKLAEYNRKRSEEVAASREGYEPRYDPNEVAAWRRAQEKAREWLEKENEARREKGLAPKVVLNMGEIVQMVSPGARPPRNLNPPPPAPPPSSPPPEVTRMPAYTAEDIETHIANVATANYGKNQPNRPSVNLVLWLAEGEDIGEHEDHFKTLTRRNKGKLKILRGLAALQNVTGF